MHLLVPTIGVATDIPAPRSEVWRSLADVASHSEWMADAESIEFASETDRGVGTVMIVETRVGPLRTSDVMVITEWAENERMGVLHMGLVEGSGVFTLTDTDDGTRFEWQERLEFPWYVGGPIAELVAAPVLWLIWTRNLMAFRRTFESDS